MSSMRPWILGLALLSACAPSSGDDSAEHVDGTNSTSASSSPSATSDAAETSTGEAESTGGGESSTGASTTGDTGLEPGPIECQETECAVSCTREYFQETESGSICGCDSPVEPEGIIECDLPSPCNGAADEEQCVAQALRYNVPGTYSVEYDDGEDLDTRRFEIFGPGMVRSVAFSQYHGCCPGSASAYEDYRRPQSTLPPDDPFWETCELDLFAPQSCFGHDLFPETACQPALTECPSLPEPGDTCEDSCPMASDGICDEEAGTGLCAAGCDPDDCTK